MYQLPSGYGYVFGVLGSSFFMNTYLIINVAMARKKYDIQYPLLYAPPGHKNEKEFNCVQRAHQNTLESYSFVMLNMCLCGLVYPKTSAALGFIWVVGRVIYGAGYASGGPSGRTLGGIIAHLGDIPLVFLALKISYDMINQ